MYTANISELCHLVWGDKWQDLTVLQEWHQPAAAGLAALLDLRETQPDQQSNTTLLIQTVLINTLYPRGCVAVIIMHVNRVS